jgi:hypothetical protein
VDLYIHSPIRLHGAGETLDLLPPEHKSTSLCVTPRSVNLMMLKYEMLICRTLALMTGLHEYPVMFLVWKVNCVVIWKCNQTLFRSCALKAV